LTARERSERSVLFKDSLNYSDNASKLDERKMSVKSGRKVLAVETGSSLIKT
jgi:hypothetical protein